MLAERNPLASPSGGRDGGEQFRLLLLQSIAELGGDLSRKHMHRHEELSSSRFPMFTVAGNTASGDQHVDVTVIMQLTVPGMQDRQTTRQRPQVTFVRTEF